MLSIIQPKEASVFMAKVSWLRLSMVAVMVLCQVARAPAQETKAKSGPRVASVYPLGATQGAVSEIEIRGDNLDGVSAVWFGSQGIKGQIKKVEQIKLDRLTPESQLLVEKEPVLGHRVLVELDVDSSAKLGRHSLRLVSPRGLSNSHPFVVTAAPVLLESQTPHESPENPQPLKIPAMVSGKLWEKGEVDYYSLDMLPGQEVVFQAVSNTPTQGSFDAIQLALYEASGSWFDPNRPTRVAFGDEPRLSYKFSKAGRYLLRVGTFLGISGPDIIYLLRVAPSAAPGQAEDLPELQASSIHTLRQPFVRKLAENRLEELLGRTLMVRRPEPGASQSASSSVQGDLDLSRPVLLEGAIDRPGKADTYNLKLKTGQRLAFELETPEATLPQFHPVLDVVDSNGQKACTNIWRRVGGDNNYYVNLVQARTIYTFERDGEYSLRIRNLISREGEPSFKYRLLIRPQVPHVGKISVKEDSLSLVAGQAGKLTVTVEQEEGYSGEVALSLENLPPGVQAFVGAETPPEKEASLDEGKKEQYVPKSQQVVVLVIGSPDAPATPLPQQVRLVARPVVDGRVGAPLLVQEIPVNVLKPDATELATTRP